MSEARVFSAIPLPMPAAAARAGRQTLFLSACSNEPCGVETFTRTLVEALGQSDGEAHYTLAAVSRAWRELPGLMRAIARSDRVVFGFPLVAWKRMLLVPLLLLLFARVIRRPVTTFAHEWTGMNWLRDRK